MTGGSPEWVGRLSLSTDIPAPPGLWSGYLISAAWRRIMLLANKTRFHFGSVGRRVHRQGSQVLVASFSWRYERKMAKKADLRWKNGS